MRNENIITCYRCIHMKTVFPDPYDYGKDACGHPDVKEKIFKLTKGQRTPEWCPIKARRVKK